MIKQIGKLTGYTEFFGDIVQSDLIFYSDGNWSFYQNNDICDYTNNIDELIKEIKNKFYDSLKDYKKDKFIDILKYIKDIGWQESSI